MKLRNKKTGEICDFLGTYSATPYFGISVDYHNGEPESYEYNSLAELNAEWEDYELKEPLIKDEKIRKAVRAWAEANDIGVVKLRQDKHRLLDSNVGIEFDTYFFEELQDGWNYTIAELCGEEE